MTMFEGKLYQGPIFVKKSPIHGYGVFAAADIPKGALIEECYSLLSTSKDDAFTNYYFKADENSAIPLGYGCIYNHSRTPNVTYDYFPDKGLIIFKAARFISRGEELCSSYGEYWFDNRKLVIKNPYRLRQVYSLGRIMWRTFLILAALWGVTHISQLSTWLLT